MTAMKLQKLVYYSQGKGKASRPSFAAVPLTLARPLRNDRSSVDYFGRCHGRAPDFERA